MDRKYVLMYVLSAIVLLNVIAIVLLNNRIVQESPEFPGQQAAPFEERPAIIVSAERPLIRTLLLENGCAECFDIRMYVEELRDLLNMDVEEADPSAFNSPRLPALAFNQKVEEYPTEFIDGWENYGYTISIPEGAYAGTWYVLPTLNAPYYDTSDGTVKGLVSVTYLDMKSCDECYDVTLNKQFLSDSRITPYQERTVDVDSSEGSALVEQYEITAVPTIIMSSEASAYTSLQPGWPVVGSIEADGSYVLRNLQRLKVVYYDLVRDEVMRP